MKLSFTIGLFLTCGALFLHTASAETGKTVDPKFTGAVSCASSSCHGGGTGRNEFVIYQTRDRHAVAYGILAKGTSQRICETLGITGDPIKATQCNICHAPMQGVPEARLTKEAAVDKGVSCEACHGPAENWIRFHTRPDVNYQQIVSAGLHDLNDLYNRANTCVACHLNLDDSIRRAGHPELTFELDGQTLDEPPHYIDARPALGPRQWLTGQATALRELSWKLGAKREDPLVPRWKALSWLLHKTDLGKNVIQEGADFTATQSAADRLAHEAAKATWTRQQIYSQLKEFAGLRAEVTDAKVDKADQRRRAQVLVPAIDRLWRAYAKDAGLASDNFDKALQGAYLAANGRGDDFSASEFGTALDALQSELSKSAK